ncbi:MAG TPA: hypothetical protein DCL60_01205 [Armatimonadetes bacterium]|jgi:hypothetical protein|nr:hypothetical protein [Armatimonadota bacterium]
MDKRYIHVEIEKSQAPKRPNEPCGDVVAWERTPTSTTLVVSDGIGSGVKAGIAAEMCVSRVLELMRRGMSQREAFAAVVRTMEQARGTDLPYAVFTIVKILNDGVATVLTYEMPAPILVTPRCANVLHARKIAMENALVAESNCHLEPGEGIIIVSDGITQAGLGRGLAGGWTIEGVNNFITELIAEGVRKKSIPSRVLRRARHVWGGANGDDCTVLLASCRWGKTVNVFTGPPRNRLRDAASVKKFLMAEGAKVVCGGTTSRIVADYLGTEVKVEANPASMLAPARYEVDGIDLVTEGAVTLNQVYNILDEDPNSFGEESGVTQLHALLRSADRINLFVGGAVNPASGDISFRQRGILTRPAILPLLTKRLQAKGKLVVTEHF